MPEEFISPIKSVNANNRSRIRSYKDVPPKSTVRSGCSLLLTLFNFAGEMATEISLASCETSCIDVLSDGNWIHLEFADDVVVLRADPSKLRVTTIV